MIFSTEIERISTFFCDDKQHINVKMIEPFENTLTASKSTGKYNDSSQWRIQKFWKGAGGAEDNLSAPSSFSSFIANAHSDR